MEPRGCNRWQPLANPPPQEPRKQAKAVAVGCDRLPGGAHGKEGVSGSSPEEGSAKAPYRKAFSFAALRFGNESRLLLTTPHHLEGAQRR
jgi:hypothetical protein